MINSILVQIKFDIDVCVVRTFVFYSFFCQDLIENCYKRCT